MLDFKEFKEFHLKQCRIYASVHTQMAKRNVVLYLDLDRSVQNELGYLDKLIFKWDKKLNKFVIDENNFNKRIDILYKYYKTEYKKEFNVEK